MVKKRTMKPIASAWRPKCERPEANVQESSPPDGTLHGNDDAGWFEDGDSNDDDDQDEAQSTPRRTRAGDEKLADNMLLKETQEAQAQEVRYGDDHGLSEERGGSEVSEDNAQSGNVHLRRYNIRNHMKHP